MLPYLRSHTRPSIRHLEAHAEALRMLPIPRTAGPHHQPASQVHGIDGIANQVGKHLPQFSRKAIEFDIRVILFFDGDP